MATLARFEQSVKAPFEMVSLSARAVDAYDAGIVYFGKTYADRISYLIDKDGRIIWTLRDPSPLAHINEALAFLSKRGA